jgi:broad specificity phosphatase PhoE
MAIDRIELHSIRHAESKKNIEPDSICGRSNEVALTWPKGTEQASTMGRLLRQAGVRLDGVYVSPAERARQTADLLLKSLGFSLVPLVDDRLQEMSQGPWEGLSRTAIYTEQMIAKILKDPINFQAFDEQTPEKGESMNQVLERKLAFLDDVVERHGERGYQQVLAVGHGLATRILAGSFLGWDAEQMRTASTPNASDTLFVYEAGAWRCEYVGQPVPQTALP